jgi:hypothetical protein
MAVCRLWIGHSYHVSIPKIRFRATIPLIEGACEAMFTCPVNAHRNFSASVDMGLEEAGYKFSVGIISWKPKSKS